MSGEVIDKGKAKNEDERVSASSFKVPGGSTVHSGNYSKFMTTDS